MEKELIDFLDWYRCIFDDPETSMSNKEVVSYYLKSINSVPSDEGVTLAENEGKEKVCTCTFPAHDYRHDVCYKCNKTLR